MPPVALRLIDISRSFGRFRAVDALTLDVLQGEVLTLLGPSGCGKTTTLRMLAGLEQPDSGELFFGDRPIVSVTRGIFVPPHKRNVGMVFQSYAIWPHMSVFDNVAYPLRVRRVRGAQIRERVTRVLELVGLAGLEQRQGPHLSGGQQQRVALARALVYQPSVLLMDEPFSNLDAKLREQMRVQIRVLLKNLGITTVFVTHDQVEALSLSDRVVLMNHGRVEQCDAPRAMYERPATAFARDFLGRTVLLEGTCADVATDHALVRLRAQPEGVLKVPTASAAALARGARVLVAIRPEEIEVRTEPATHEDLRVGELPGTVEALLFVGDHNECRVRIGEGESLLLNVPRSLPLREGAHVRLRIAGDGVSLWPTPVAAHASE